MTMCTCKQTKTRKTHILGRPGTGVDPGLQVCTFEKQGCGYNQVKERGRESHLFNQALETPSLLGRKRVGRQGEKDEGRVCCSGKQLDFQAAWKT